MTALEELFEQQQPFRWLYGLVVLALVGLVVWSMQPVLSPLVVFALFLYVSWPLRQLELPRRVILAVTILFSIWMVHAAGSLAAPFVLAFIFAYILDPAIRELQEKGVPRSLGIVLLALPLIGGLFLVGFLVVPVLARQLSELIAQVPMLLDSLQGLARDLRGWVIGLDLAGINAQTLPAVSEFNVGQIMSYLQSWQGEITRGGGEMIFGLSRGLGSLASVLGYVVLTPVLTYYLLRDWPKLGRQLARILPDHRRRPVMNFLGEYDRLLSRYLRGQLTLALIVGLIVGVGFWLVDFPYAVLLGLVAGIFNLVPYLGFIVGAATALLVALFATAFPAGLLKVVLVFGIQQGVEAVLGPHIVGESVGLHPVWVILSIALFGLFFGFVGLLLAVPLAVLLKLGLQSALADELAISPPEGVS